MAKKRLTKAKAPALPVDDRLEKLRVAHQKVGPYQPLYGVDGFGDSQRATTDRGEAICGYFAQKITGLRVLDVGCYFGYLTFYLADRGARATGWDYWEPNIDICTQLRAINGIAADFDLSEFGPESVSRVGSDQYDVALILSVLHWTVHQKGLEYVQRSMAELMQKVPVVVVELAQKGEGQQLSWDAAAPARDLDVFNLVPDVQVEKIGEFPSQIPENKRPLYVVSKKKAR